MSEFSERDRAFGLIELNEDDRNMYLDMLRSVYSRSYASILNDEKVKRLKIGERASASFTIPRVKANSEMIEDSNGVMGCGYLPIDDHKGKRIKLEIGIVKNEQGILPRDYVISFPDANLNSRYALFASESDGGDMSYATTYGADPEKLAIELLDSWNAQLRGWKSE